MFNLNKARLMYLDHNCLTTHASSDYAFQDYSKEHVCLEFCNTYFKELVEEAIENNKKYIKLKYLRHLHTFLEDGLRFNVYIPPAQDRERSIYYMYVSGWEN